ncbi:MAG: hypothetical protein K8R64_01410 [Methanosarcinaceae archaeon]|nr:hypothetical protein [Methanosarcinaceae archaeon]
MDTLLVIVICVSLFAGMILFTAIGLKATADLRSHINSHDLRVEPQDHERIDDDSDPDE